ncbi:RHS repeat-associated core domain-containing protein [Conexibacter sp. CPCC 206217]|uniref:RHS repeat-associated core domain-containing protein n=1 Tax=Conexibacter sp. CPCC 206217 TaxID=3064574 RepID=UPI0027264BC0|nr:RHS repeat-associated core domain-containing protein [Conexibacter sp. CPCC 206217]MDO8209638.1 RHS repeat-associated core domain-containing protein [Conexibacter sp. CPCC 206217]
MRFRGGIGLAVACAIVGTACVHAADAGAAAWHQRWGAATSGNRESASFDTYPVSDRESISVDRGSGFLAVNATDLSIAGTGLSFEFPRTYSSAMTTDGGLGLGWASRWTAASIDNSVANQFWFQPGDGARYGFTYAGGRWGSAIKVDATGAGANPPFTLTWRETGERWTFGSASQGELVSVSDRNGNTVRPAYDGRGALASITDSQGRVLTVTTDATGVRVTRVADPSGRSWVYAYDGSGQLTSVQSPTGDRTLYGYTSSRLTSVTSPAGNVTRIAYVTGTGRVESVTQTTDALHTTGPTTRYAYTATPAAGCPASPSSSMTTVTDPNGFATRYCADASFSVVKTIDPLGGSASTEWGPREQVARFTAASNASSGISTASTFDADGVLQQTRQGLEGGRSLTTSYTYGVANPFLPQTETDPNGRVLTRTYDSVGNLTDIADSSTPAVQATLAYGSRGLVSSATDPNGNVTRYGYDTAGNLTSITPAAVSTGSQIGVTRIAYDSLSRPTRITDGRGVSRTYTYDLLDRVTRVVPDTGTTTTYDYDDDGNLLARTDASGTTAYRYDPLGQLTSRSSSGNSTSYAYDPAGNLTRFTDVSGTVTYTYDRANRLASLRDPSGDLTTFAYDADGERTRTTYPNSVAMTRELDAGGRLLRLTTRVDDFITGEGSSELASYTYTYDGDRRATMIDGIAGEITFYSYGDDGRLQQVTVRDGALGPILRTYQYSYDAAGNITRRTDNAGSVTYAYNQDNLLVSDTSTAGATYTYDGAGQLTAGPGRLALGYNAMGQTTSFLPPAGTRASATYAGHTQTEQTQDGSTDLRNTLLGISSTVTGGRATYYVRDNDGTLISQLRPGGDTYYYLYDGQGNVSGLADTVGDAEYAATVQGSYSYDPYGRRTATGLTDPFGYNAGYTTNGFVHYGYRWYDSNTGRWTQQDPLDQAADLSNGNRYAYAGADPINDYDLTGLSIFGDVFNSAVDLVETGAVCAGGAAGAAGSGGLAIGAAVAVCGITAGRAGARIGHRINGDD